MKHHKPLIDNLFLSVPVERETNTLFEDDPLELPVTDGRLPASHVPISPEDFDFSALRRQTLTIAELVEFIEESLADGVSGLLEPGPGEATPSPKLRTQFSALGDIGSLDLRHYQLAPGCELYLECAEQCGFQSSVGTTEADNESDRPSDEPPGKHEPATVSILEMTRAIAAGLESPQHRARLDAQRQSARRDQHAVRRFARSLIKETIRILTVRLTLAFRPQALFSVTPEYVRSALRDLLRTARLQRQFQPMLGFVWVMQDHPVTGPRVRLLALFNGDHVTKAQDLAVSLGELWEEAVTGGKGLSLSGLIQDGKTTAPCGSMVETEGQRSELVELAASLRNQPLAPLVVSGPTFGFGRIQGDPLGTSTPKKGFLAELE